MKPTAVIVMFVLCMLLVGCGVLMGFLEAAGVTVSPEAKAAAAKADQLTGWTLGDYVFGGSMLLNILGGAQRGHAAVKRRRTKKQAAGHITPQTTG